MYFTKIKLLPQSLAPLFLITLSLIFIGLNLLSTASATTIKTELNRNPISINDSFQLTFSTTESPDNDPDFSVLETHFDILNQNKSSQTSLINGQRSHQTQWSLSLMAKKTGSLLIPPVPFGSDMSQPITLIVKQALTHEQQANKELFLMVEASPDKVSVQSQVIYTLRVYHRGQIAQASLNEPKMLDALIEKLGEDKNYKTTYQGVEYLVIERKYAIFPQKSGSMTIEPIVLDVEVLVNGRQRLNRFFNRQSTQTKRIVSESITLQVKAAPTHFTGKYWLPSKTLYLEEQWSGDTDTMQVGEPLTRTLRLVAQGTALAQLPQIKSEQDIAPLKTYPDQAVLKQRKEQTGITSLREEKIAYIPAKAGTFTLPAIEIPWFNTQTQTMEIARIPERIVTAIAPTTETQDTINSIVNTTTAQPDIQVIESKFWLLMSIGLAIGWLFTLLFFIIRKPQKKSTTEPTQTKNTHLKTAIKTLKQACAENNPIATKDALLIWGKIRFGCHNLTDIAHYGNDAFKDELNHLSRSLYASQTDNSWQGNQLLSLFNQNDFNNSTVKDPDDPLENLFNL